MISGKIMTTGILMTIFVAGINSLTFVEPTTPLIKCGRSDAEAERRKNKAKAYRNKSTSLLKKDVKPWLAITSTLTSTYKTSQGNK